MKHFYFRVDSSREIGIGHLIRCLNFGRYLHSNNYHVTFIVRDLPGNSINLIDKKFNKIILKDKNILKKNKWLGVSKNEEVSDLTKILKKIGKCFLIIDHYGIDYTIQKKLKHKCKKLICINDIPNRKFFCDIVINPNLVSKRSNNSYHKNKNTIYLEGLEYNFLPTDYQELRRRSLQQKNNKLKNILVYFGGSDSKNLTLNILNSISRNRYQITVIIHKNYRDYNLILNKFSKYKNIKIINKFTNIAKLMIYSDLLICSAGSVNWLRCYFGVPAITILTAQNQKIIYTSLNKINACIGIKKNQIKNLNNIIIDKKNSFLKMSYVSRNILLESGLEKILGSIINDKNYHRNLELRNVNKNDINYLFKLENTKNVRVYFKNPKNINLSEHKKWFNKTLNLETSIIFIICLNKKNVGMLRVDNLNKNIVDLSILIHPKYSNSNLGNQSLSLLIHQIYNKQIRAQVHVNNISANLLFKGLGFSTNKLTGKFNNLILDKSRHILMQKNGNKLVNIITSQNSWVVNYISLLKKIIRSNGYAMSLSFNADTKSSYYINFLLGYPRLLNKEQLQTNKYNLVIHESDLPKGKGFSPISWQILNNKNLIPVSMFEAVEKMDSGPIYIKDNINLKGTELSPEWRKLQAEKTISLCKRFLKNIDKIKPQNQQGLESFYSKRDFKDSELNINKSLKSQFQLLRITDNDKYPAYFNFKNETYYLKIYKKK